MFKSKSYSVFGVLLGILASNVACTLNHNTAKPVSGSTHSVSLNVKFPEMPSSTNLSLASDAIYIPFHIALRIEGQKNFVFSKVINTSQDLELTVPEGELKIKAVYMVEGVSKADYDAMPLGLCNTAEDNYNIFSSTAAATNHSEYVSSVDFTKNPTNGELLNIAFPALQQANGQIPFALKIRGGSLTSAAGIGYKDTIVGGLIAMPCKDGTFQAIQKTPTASMLVYDSVPAINGSAIATLAIIDGTSVSDIPLALTLSDISKNFFYLDLSSGSPSISNAYDDDFDADGVSNSVEVAANNNPLPYLPPAEITGLSATPASDTTVTLTWTSGGGSTAGYKVSYASGATAPTTCAAGTVLDSGAINGTTAAIAGLTANTQYSFRVCAINGNATPDMSSGATASATTLPPAPDNLSVSPGIGLATLSWSTVSGATGYVIYYSTSAGVTKETATRVVVEAPSYQLTGLSNATTYYFNIAAIVGATESNLSSHEVSATVYPAPPSAPGGVYLSFAYNKALQLHFNTVSGAVSYKAYYKTAAGVTTSDTFVAGVSEGYIISGLNTFGTYYVKVSAVDAYGQESSLSAEVSYRLYEYSLIPQNNASYNQLPISRISRTYASGSTIYAATQLGVSISTNAGSTWVNKNIAHGLSSTYVASVYAIGSTIYAATQAGISISTNAGLTWLNKSTASGLASNDTRDIYAISSNIYVATYDAGLLLSTDNGVTWSNKTTANGLGSNEIRRMVVSDTNIYAATATGVAISTNNGATWVNKTTANGLGGDDVRAISMAGSTIYAATIGGLSVSTNGGASWTNTATACGVSLNGLYSVYALGTNIYLSPSGGTIGICMSTDSGNTWTAKTTANGLGGNMVADVYAQGNNVYASIEFGGTVKGGLSVSTNNGSTWTHTEPIVPSDINRMVATGTSIYAATSTGLYISTNSGTTWTNKTTANGLGSNLTRGVYVSGSNIYVATSGVSISTNGGNTWVTKTTANGLGNNSVKAIYVDGANLYAATLGGLSISTNGGTNWQNKTSANGLAATSLLSVFAVGSNIYAGTNGSGLSISTNGGTTWATKNNLNTLGGIGENHINNIYHDGTSIYLATENGVSISTDSGTTWVNKVSTDFPDDYIYSVIASNGSIYAATEHGIKISTDNGTSWLRKNETTGLDSWITWITLSGTSVYLAGYNGIYASGL